MSYTIHFDYMQDDGVFMSFFGLIDSIIVSEIRESLKFPF